MSSLQLESPLSLDALFVKISGAVHSTKPMLFHEANWLTNGDSDAINFHFQHWSRDVYVLMPGAVYAGNRFPAFADEYSPRPRLRSPSDPDQRLHITEIPRLLCEDGPSRLRQLSTNLAVPGVGFFFPELQRGLWIITSELDANHPLVFDLEENENRTESTLRVEPDTSSAETRFSLLVKSFPANEIQALFDELISLRNVTTANITRQEDLPFSEACAILRDKYERENWVEPQGYYAVGTEPVRSTTFSQNWQMGWVGGMISAHAMLLTGAESTRRVLRNFDFVFPRGQSPSGFFYGNGDGEQFFGDAIKRIPNSQMHLVRKSADGLYYMISSLEVLRERNLSHFIKETWMNGLRRCADAFVRLWDENGQFGQYVDLNTGEIVVAHSTSGAMAPGALALAARVFPERAGDYLRVAKAAGRAFAETDLKSGVTSGGPGDALQCADSESIASLVESYGRLYEADSDPYWLNCGKQAATQLASWVVSYDYIFPPESTFGRMGMQSRGTVLANTQNKHSAPGLCTHSGASLFRLFRATGWRPAFDLLQDIAHSLPQYLSRNDRPIEWKMPFVIPDDPSQKTLPSGWMCERVNLAKWGEYEQIGEVFYCSCWPEVSLLLSCGELPGIYAQPDTGLLWVCDHLNVRWAGENHDSLLIENPTRCSAIVRILIETSKEAKNQLNFDYLQTLSIVKIPAGESVQFT